MNVEDRLVQAFGHADRMEPSPDLWTRVVHSIEEDQLHRRRIVGTALGGVALTVALVVTGALTTIDGFAGRHVRWQVMEVLEVIALVAMIVALGPGIRRFGRGYASDLFTSSRPIGAAVLRLLDVAYFLIFGGYVLLSLDFPDTLDRRLATELAVREVEQVHGFSTSTQDLYTAIDAATGR